MNVVVAPALRPIRRSDGAAQSPPSFTNVAVTPGTSPTYHEDGIAARAAPSSKRSLTGLRGSVPNVNCDQSSVVPLPDIVSVPSESVVTAAREEPSVRVPAPVLVSAPAVGAVIVATTSAATETVGTVSVAVPLVVTVAFWLNTSASGSAFSVSVTVASAVLKMALLWSYQTEAALLQSHNASVVFQFAAAPPFQVRSCPDGAASVKVKLAVAVA